jgi:hypothetical protein
MLPELGVPQARTAAAAASSRRFGASISSLKQRIAAKTGEHTSSKSKGNKEFFKKVLLVLRAVRARPPLPDGRPAPHAMQI